MLVKPKEQGQGLVEYSIVLLLLAVAFIALMSLASPQQRDLANEVGSNIADSIESEGQPAVTDVEILLDAPVVFVKEGSSATASGGEVLFRLNWEPTDSGCYYDGMVRYGKIEIKMPTVIREDSECLPSEALQIAQKFLDDAVEKIQELTHDTKAVQFVQRAGDAVLEWLSGFVYNPLEIAEERRYWTYYKVSS